MFKLFLLHTYTLVVLMLVITYAVGSMGYVREALVVAMLLTSAIVAWNMFSQGTTLWKIFSASMFIGVAALVWPWSAVGYVLLLIVLLGPLKVFSLHAVWVSLLGLLTPVWCYAPYWLYNNIEYVEQEITSHLPLIHI